MTIPAGEFIGVSILAANRDPETFEDPDTAEQRFGPVDILVNNATGWLADSFAAAALVTANTITLR